jgi:rubrerythrin
MEILRIYEYALSREKEGKRFFEENATRLQNAAASSAFRRLVIEEQKHIDYIQFQIDELTGQPSTFEGIDLTAGDNIFAKRAENENVRQSVDESMVADLPVLRMAYLIERDFAEFYEMASRKVEGEAREVLTMLANWEHSHERLFKSLHDTAFELYADMPWGG